MKQEKSYNCRISVQDPRVLFVYVFYQPNLDTGRLLSDRTGWTIREDDADKRLYDRTYVYAVPPCYSIEQPSLTIDRVDTPQLQRLGGRRTTSVPYKKLLVDHPDVLSGTSLDTRVRIYSSGIVAIRLGLEMSGEYDTDHIVALLNALLDFSLPFRDDTGQRRTLDSLAEGVLGKVVDLLSKQEPSLDVCTKYSILIPEKIIPGLPAIEYFDEEYEKEIFALAIRRIEDWRHIALPLARRYQRNVGFSDKDVVMLNVNHALVYLPGRMSPEVFVRAIEALNATSFTLKHYDLVLSRRLKGMETEYHSAEQLSAQITDIEKLRIDVLSALEMFRMLTAAASFRVARILERGREVFGTEDLAQVLMDRLEVLDAILENHYDAKTLQELRRIGDLIEALIHFQGSRFEESRS